MTENIVPDPTVPERGDSSTGDVDNGQVGTPKVGGVSPTVKKSSPFLFIALTLLSLVSILAIYLFLQVRTLTLEQTTPSPTPSPIATADPTTNWQTYSDDKLGFEFKYPATYSKNQENQNPVSIQSPLLPPGKGYELRDGELKVEVYHNPSQTGDTLDKYVESIVSTSQRGALSTIKTEIAGQEAVKIESSNGDLYLLIHNKYRIQISKMPRQTSKQVEFDQILSTFKFTDNSATDDKSILMSLMQNTVFNYGKDHGLTNQDQIIITVTKLEGNYAAGNTSFKSDVGGSGSGWIAAKVNNKWIVVEQFQEPPSCQLVAQYQFPKSIYGDCIDK